MYVPAVQEFAVQVMAPVLKETVPDGHGLQWSDLSWSWYVCTGHGSHVPLTSREPFAQKHWPVASLMESEGHGTQTAPPVFFPFVMRIVFVGHLFLMHSTLPRCSA